MEQKKNESINKEIKVRLEKFQETITEETQTMLQEWKQEFEFELANSLTMDSKQSAAQNIEKEENKKEKEDEDIKDMKNITTGTTKAKQLAKEIEGIRKSIEACSNNTEIKMEKMTQRYIRDVSQRFTTLIDDLSLLRIRLRMQFEHFISKLLKTQGLSFNKRILNKILDTDYIENVVLKEHQENASAMIRSCKMLRAIYFKFKDLESGLTSTYDEFSKTAEILIKREMVYEEIGPPLEEVIDFANEIRRLMNEMHIKESEPSGIIQGLTHSEKTTNACFCLCVILGIIAVTASAFFFIFMLIFYSSNNKNHNDTLVSKSNATAVN